MTGATFVKANHRFFVSCVQITNQPYDMQMMHA